MTVAEFIEYYVPEEHLDRYMHKLSLVWNIKAHDAQDRLCTVLDLNAVQLAWAFSEFEKFSHVEKYHEDE